MLETLKRILRENYDIKTVEKTSNFKKDFGLTSFDFVNLLCLIEEQFGVEIEEKDYRRLNTMDELVQYLEMRTTKACKGEQR